MLRATCVLSPLNLGNTLEVLSCRTIVLDILAAKFTLAQRIGEFQGLLKMT